VLCIGSVNCRDGAANTRNKSLLFPSPYIQYNKECVSYGEQSAPPFYDIVKSGGELETVILVPVDTFKILPVQELYVHYSA
jgi:hypothetical protein